MRRSFRNINFYLMVLADSLLIAGAYVAAHILRFEGNVPDYFWVNIKSTLPLIIPLKIIGFFVFKLYRGMWRYTSISDMKNVLQASVTTSVLSVFVILYLYRFHGYSRSVFIIDGVLTFLFVSGIRVFIRLLLYNNRDAFWSLKRVNKEGMKGLLVIGAGDAGEKVLREIQENPEVRYAPVGFLDDDVNKIGMSIHGIPVIGKIAELESMSDGYDEIVIAIPSAKSDQMRRVVSLCEKTGKRFRTLPGIGELINGRVSVNAIREVRLEDIMGREEVRLDRDDIHDYIMGKRILVTGAGGSIGSELVRQIGPFEPEALALIDFSEFNLYNICGECCERYPETACRSFLVDIKDRDALNRVYREFDPHVVFHAAAYKHVPMQEYHPWEAVRNNVLGTRNLVDASIESGVGRFVLVSTDKAVRPTSVMGATKRIAELFVESMNGNTRTKFMAVRFGNVIGSSGSVIPLFQRQISRGEPVTVTHPDITRYFMSIPEAAQLILQAGAMGTGGEIFVLNMGNPVRISDVARDLIRLNGLEPEKDIPIVYVGLRPGEKLYEELITEGEGIVKTNHEKIMVLHGDSSEKVKLNGKIDELLVQAGAFDADAIKEKIHHIVPEYKFLGREKSE